jgi:hypothetical protein
MHSERLSCGCPQNRLTAEPRRDLARGPDFVRVLARRVRSFPVRKACSCRVLFCIIHSVLTFPFRGLFDSLAEFLKALLPIWAASPKQVTCVVNASAASADHWKGQMYESRCFVINRLLCTCPPRLS